MKSTTLVTGGAGYIGSHTTLALLESGYEVVVLDDLSTGFRSLVPSDALFVEGNVGDIQLLEALIKEHSIEAVIHFAGSIIVPESVVNPVKYYKNNTVQSSNLIESCVSASVEKFIFSSTAAVYGNTDISPVKETTPTAPLSPYGTTKLMTEWMLRDVSKATSLRHVCLRYFNVAGADRQGRSGQARPEATHLLKIACETALGRKSAIEIYGDDYSTPDGTGVRDYIHVSDLAKAHVAALAYLDKGGESTILNCGYGKGRSVRDVLNVVEKVSGTTINVSVADRRSGDVGQLVAENQKILSTLDWKPENDDLETIVRTALEWERSLPDRDL